MTFMVTLIALLIERFFDWNHLRRWQWLLKIEHYTTTRFKNLSSLMQLIFIVIPVLISVGFFKWLISGWLYGLVTFLFQIVVLIYSFGPKNLWAGTFAQLLTFKETKNVSNSTIIHAEFNNPDQHKLYQQQFLKQIFVDANNSIFAIVCWYMVMGTLGAIFYRMISVTAEQKEESSLKYHARVIQNILDWVPARIFTVLLALAGHFTLVLKCWRKYVLLRISQNEILLADCGIAALGYEEPVSHLNTTKDKEAINLLDRAFIIALILIAIFVLIF